MKKNKHWPLIIGISIPIVMILLLAGSIYIPKILVKPQGKFLYLSIDDATQSQRYQVKDGRLVKEASEQKWQYDRRYLPRGESHLYLYDVKVNQAIEISFDDAKKLTLDPSKESPNGFEIACFKREEGMITLLLGPIGDCNSRYLAGNGISKKLNLTLNALPANVNFRFLGWVIS